MRPYDKFECFGPEQLTDAELIAIMLRTGTKAKDSLQIAQQLLDSVPEHDLLGLYHCSYKELMRHEGIGKVKAIKLKCVFEFAKRIAIAKRPEKILFNNPEVVAGYFMEEMRHLECEQVLLVMLDQKMHYIFSEFISKGTVSASAFSSREIFLTALRYEAVNILLLHNHPSGDPTPSKQDYLITEQIMKAGQLMGIPLRDHIIIGDHKFYSMLQNGHM